MVTFWEQHRGYVEPVDSAVHQEREGNFCREQLYDVLLSIEQEEPKAITRGICVV